MGPIKSVWVISPGRVAVCTFEVNGKGCLFAFDVWHDTQNGAFAILILNNIPIAS